MIIEITLNEFIILEIVDLVFGFKTQAKLLSSLSLIPSPTL